jgi:Vault protein inter-alpha-trypsin domain/von Willebrand factor type A domain
MASSPSLLCGCFYITSTPNSYPQKKYLPQVDLSSHTTILSTTSRTVLTQTFLNPSKNEKLDQVQYMFPLYDGVTVVGFKCTVAGRVIVGSVKEKQQARKEYKKAVDRGETAGLLEQFSSAADCFTTRVGNIPANDKVVVQITYLGELKHDAETDGVRFTIPTNIAPRYGSEAADAGGLPEKVSSAKDKGGIRILVDIAVEDGVTIRGVQSPSHPIAMIMGRTSSMPEEAFDNQHASATLTLGTMELDKEFIIVVTSKGHDTPRALLEAHPTIPNHRALMATLVPKFNLPSARPEIIFVADRSGSMHGNIPTLVSALKIFLKSLPLGVKFNICSFGSSHSFLWPKSKTYDESSLSGANSYVESFAADLGGTEMLGAIKETVKNRYKDMHLEVIVVTDGEIWQQTELFSFINEATTQSVRFFSLGIGAGASSSLVEGIARAGNGFAQFAGENEKMEKRVVRMLKGALSPHIKDYSMEVKYENADEGYEMVESATESLKGLDTSLESSQSKLKKKVISLFDKSTKVDDNIDSGAGKYDHLPTIVTPKLLQAPHKIPPLYPFNRTTVYLLMSVDSCQHTPKAIVLRATSEHGPLELEIPVQDVGIGQTIHQLATRKAVVELEEGRGWITEASDRDGKVIKKKYEGRWDEIVEREAVRLGVQFQVANKWCSFVAVEENADIEEALPDYEMIDNGGVEGYTSQRSTSHAKGQPSVDKKYHLPFGGSSSPSQAQPQGFLGLSAMAAGSYAPSTPTPSARLERGFAARSMKVLDTSKIRRQLASTAAPPSAPRGLSSYGIPQASRKRSAVPIPMPQPQRSDMSADAVAADESIEYAVTDHVYSTPIMSRSASEPETADPPMTNEEKMLELVSLQSFDGSWQMTNKFLLTLGLNEAMLTALLQLENTVVATLVAVGFLECKVPEEEGVWEMIVEKAKGWLDGKIGESGAAEGLAKVKKYVF